MNYSGDWGNRGAKIKPSARPSIHNHESCIFAAYAGSSMGRFGVDDGVDEVDNALSKLSEPISPLMFEKFKNNTSIQNSSRRNSLNNANRNYTDDDTNLLSKSAPATLPSQLRYSDGSDDEQASAHSRHSNESFHSNRSPVVNRNRSASNGSLSNGNVGGDTQGKSNPLFKLAVPLIFALFGLAYMKLNTNEDNQVIYDECMFYSDIIDLGHKYKVDENNILKVQTGISTIFRREDVGSFIFMYNSENEYFNKPAFDKFINEVSFTASKYLRNDTIPLNYIVVEGKDLNMKEPSEVMCKFREDLHKSGVMLVKDIEAIPSSLAMAFHYFCDEYNPLVKKSAIFFTIDLAKCFSEETKKTKYTAIENCLANKWTSIPRDSIGPLLARVVSVVIDVTSVF